MRVLVTGVTGLLGSYFADAAPEDVELIGLSRRVDLPINGVRRIAHLDLRRKSQLLDFLDCLKPEALVHCAAEGSVDAVEKSPDEFYELNVLVPELLAQWAAINGSQLIHISSNAVFGDSGFPHADFDTHSPINQYGRFKAEAEDRVMAANPDSAIVRPIFLYGWNPEGSRPNPAAEWTRKLRSGETVNVVSDVLTQPLWARDCAEVLWLSLRKRVCGPINVSGGVTLSLLDFARALADTFELDTSRLIEARLRDFRDLAPRPRTTEFALTRMHTDLGYKSLGPIEGLESMRQEEVRNTQ